MAGIEQSFLDHLARSLSDLTNDDPYDNSGVPVRPQPIGNQQSLYSAFQGPQHSSSSSSGGWDSFNSGIGPLGNTSFGVDSSSNGKQYSSATAGLGADSGLGAPQKGFAAKKESSANGLNGFPPSGSSNAFASPLTDSFSGGKSVDENDIEWQKYFQMFYSGAAVEAEKLENATEAQFSQFPQQSQLAPSSLAQVGYPPGGASGVRPRPRPQLSPASYLPPQSQAPYRPPQATLQARPQQMYQPQAPRPLALVAPVANLAPQSPQVRPPAQVHYLPPQIGFPTSPAVRPVAPPAEMPQKPAETPSRALLLQKAQQIAQTLQTPLNPALTQPALVMTFPAVGGQAMPPPSLFHPVVIPGPQPIVTPVAAQPVILPAVPEVSPDPVAQSPPQPVASDQNATGEKVAHPAEGPEDQKLSPQKSKSASPDPRDPSPVASTQSSSPKVPGEKRAEKTVEQPVEKRDEAPKAPSSWANVAKFPQPEPAKADDGGEWITVKPAREHVTPTAAASAPSTSAAASTSVPSTSASVRPTKPVEQVYSQIDPRTKKNWVKPTSKRSGRASPDTLKLYNQRNYPLSPAYARYFVIKSYSEEDIHKSIKYSIWASTDQGNRRLDAAFQESEKRGPVFLFFSFNGSGHFQGMAQMMSKLDYEKSSDVWAESKWKGHFKVQWLVIKDLPNPLFRHVTLANNEGKPVTNSRDTQEVPSVEGKEVVRIFTEYPYYSSILDDFSNYDAAEASGKKDA